MTVPLATRRLSNAFSNPSPQPLFLHRLCLNEYDSHPTAHTAVRAHTFARSNSCTVSILLVMTAAWRAFTPWGRLHMFKQNSPYRRRNESTSAAAPYQAAATRMFVMLSIDRLSKRPCGTHNTTAAHIQNSATRSSLRHATLIKTQFLHTELPYATLHAQPFTICGDRAGYVQRYAPWARRRPERKSWTGCRWSSLRFAAPTQTAAAHTSTSEAVQQSADSARDPFSVQVTQTRTDL